MTAEILKFPGGDFRDRDRKDKKPEDTPENRLPDSLRGRIKIDKKGSTGSDLLDLMTNLDFAKLGEVKDIIASLRESSPGVGKRRNVEVRREWVRGDTVLQLCARINNSMPEDVKARPTYYQAVIKELISMGLNL